MKYLITADLETGTFIDRATQEILKVAVTAILRDNLEDCEVSGVRVSEYGRSLNTDAAAAAIVGDLSSLAAQRTVPGLKQNDPTVQ